MTAQNYYDHEMESLTELTNRRTEMEKNFSRDNRREYDKICDAQVKNAAELIKLGVNYEATDNGTVRIFLANGGHAEIAHKELMDHMGVEQFYLFFPYAADDIEGPVDSQQQYEPLGANMTYNPMNNPLTLLLTSLLGQLSPLNTGITGNMQSAYPSTAGISEQKILNERIIALTKEKEAARKELETAKTDCEKFKATVMEMTTQTNEKTDKINELAGVISSKEEIIASLSTQIEEAQKALEELEILKENQMSEIANIQARTTEKDEMLNSLRDQLTEFGSIQSENVKLRKDLEDLRSEKEDIDKMTYELIESEDVYHKKVELLNDELKRKEDEISDTQRKIEEYEKEVSSKNDTIQVLESDIRTTEEELQACRMENDTLKATVDEVKKTLEDIRQQLSFSLTKIKTLEEDIIQKDALVARLKTENQQLESSVEMLKAERDDSEKEVEAIKEVNETLYKAAFIDGKFEIPSETAFYEVINNPNTSEDTESVAVIDICGMTEINDAYDEEVGDNVIRITISKITDVFASDVYRIRGGQIAVLSSIEYREMLSILKRLVKTLKAEDIDVVFGLATVSHSQSLKNAWSAARKILKNNVRHYKRTIASDAKENEYAIAEEDNASAVPETQVVDSKPVIMKATYDEFENEFDSTVFDENESEDVYEEDPGVDEHNEENYDNMSGYEDAEPEEDDDDEAFNTDTDPNKSWMDAYLNNDTYDDSDDAISETDATTVDLLMTED